MAQPGAAGVYGLGDIVAGYIAYRMEQALEEILAELQEKFNALPIEFTINPGEQDIEDLLAQVETYLIENGDDEV